MWHAPYYVRYIKFPYSINGCTVPGNDGSFTIFINSLLSESIQREALRHELRHVSLDHFYSDEEIADIEAQARGEASSAHYVDKHWTTIPGTDPPEFIPLYEDPDDVIIDLIREATPEQRELLRREGVDEKFFRRAERKK